VIRTYILTLLTLLAGAGASAQIDTGNISGAIRDSSGAVLQRAVVKIVNSGTSASVAVLTDDNGFYSAPALRPGVYEVTASALGFQTARRPNIQVRVQDRLAIDFELAVASSDTVVNVTEAVPLLESQSTSLGHVVEERTIRDLPLNGRNFMGLATLGAGTSPSRRGPERDTFVANGARPIQNSYLLDGIENKNKIVGFDSSSAQVIQPVLDGIQEFKVQTNTFSAEFGQSAGAVVNVTLKSGTNQLHGSAYEFLRNSALDAKPYFQPTSVRPQFVQNLFGATIGGPAIKDRTFGFFSWQSQREVNAAPQLATVPLAAQRAGHFSTPTYDPATTRLAPDGKTYVRDLFPSNLIPQARWDPVSAKLANLFPDPVNSAASSNFFSNQRQRVSNDQYNLKIDHRIGDKDSFFARFSSTSNTNVLPSTLPPPANNPSIAKPTGRSWAASETHTFAPTVLNELRFGYMETRLVQYIDAPRQFDEYGIIGAPNLPNVVGLPTFSVSGLTTIGSTGPAALPTPATGSGNFPIDKQGVTLQLSDNLSIVRGRHTLKIGADFQQVTLYADSTLSARPSFSFNGVYTQNPQQRSGTGAAYADFLLGYTSSASVSTRSLSESRQHIVQGYIQDDWNVNSRLTLNLGLRYELALPFYETADHYSNLILEPGPLYGRVLDVSQAEANGYRRSFVDPDFNNLAPRAGLAYKATQKTVVRSAFGVFYGRDENIPVARRPTNNPPYFIQKTYTSDQINPLIRLATGFPADALDPVNIVNPDVNAYLKRTPLPYVLQWNLNVQQELPGSFVLDVGYVGSGARRLYTPLNVNLPTPGAGAINPRRPIQGYSAVFALAPVVNSSYNALLAQLERRFTSGFSLLAGYTYGHSIDYAGANAEQDTGPQNPRDLTPNRGNSNFDLRHRVVFSSAYELPFGRGKAFLSNSRTASAILGGWQLSGITSWQTGLPLTPVLNFDPSNTGTTGRPNRIASGELSGDARSITRWFDVSAFAAPSGFVFGNSGRNILRGPSQYNTDIGLSRSLHVTERVGLQIRAEAFNLFNTPQFGLPAATIGNANAGVISTVVTPERQLQFALRLAF
jgi:hypothetical protein